MEVLVKIIVPGVALFLRGEILDVRKREGKKINIDSRANTAESVFRTGAWRLDRGEKLDGRRHSSSGWGVWG